VEEIKAAKEKVKSLSDSLLERYLPVELQQYLELKPSFINF